MQAPMIAWIVTYLLHSTILVLGAWLLERRWADRPERMSAVWKTALVGGLLTATAQTGLGLAPAAARWELSPELASAAEAEVPTVSVGEPVAVGEPLVRSWPPPDWAVALGGQPGAVVLDRADEPMLAAASIEPVPTAVELAPVPTPARAGVTRSAAETASPWVAVVPWVLALLGAGALLGLASVLVAFVALHQRLGDRRALVDGTLPLLLDGLRRRAGLSRRVPLTVAPRVQVPMAVGVLRPEIVVPPKAAHGLSVAHQESLLAHELAHVLRRDPSWRLVALLAERVFFFQPLNRLASRRIAQSAEYLCDDWAARHTKQPLALASCLTEIATWVARPGPVAATMAGPRSILGRRVHRLLQSGPTNARPWWLSAALGLPLLGVVAMAPGVDARAAKPQRHGDATPIVIIDEEGRRHEIEAPAGGAVVVHERDGELHVEALDDDAREAELAESAGSPRKARKAARRRERAVDDARRQARKDLRRAFREAQKRGDAAPSRREVEAILRGARQAEGRPERHRSRHSDRAEHMEVHVAVPGGVEVHGRVPLGAEELEALELFEQAKELEQLGPMLEELERELEQSGVDVVIRHREGDIEPQVHIVVPPEHERARDRQRDAERARRRAMQERAREQRREHEHLERDVHREAERIQREHEHLERDAHREAERIQREAEQIRRRIERVQQERRGSSELPTVWNHVVPPAPPAPPVAPAVAPSRRVAPIPPVAPAVAPSRRVAPAPPAPPAPPAADESPVVWVSWSA